MSGGGIIHLSEWQERKRRKLAIEAQEAERERRQREDSERLRRLLDGDWPPPGGHAA